MSGPRGQKRAQAWGSFAQVGGRQRTRHNRRQMGRAGTLLTACILSAVGESRPSPESEAGAQGRAVVGRERGSTKQVRGERPREMEKHIFYKIS